MRAGARSLAMEKAKKNSSSCSSASSALPASINDIQSNDSLVQLLSPAPSAALFGLLLIGNLDHIYHRDMCTRPLEFLDFHSTSLGSCSWLSRLGIGLVVWNRCAYTYTFVIDTDSAFESSRNRNRKSTTKASSCVRTHVISPSSNPNPNSLSFLDSHPAPKSKNPHPHRNSQPGRFLLFQHIFSKKLYLRLCWDVIAFEEGYMVRLGEYLEDALEEVVVGLVWGLECREGPFTGLIFFSVLPADLSRCFYLDLDARLTIIIP
jgi:hypothetical protein